MSIEYGTNIPNRGRTQHYDILRELGDCYHAVGNTERAQLCYEKATRLKQQLIEILGEEPAAGQDVTADRQTPDTISPARLPQLNNLGV